MTKDEIVVELLGKNPNIRAWKIKKLQEKRKMKVVCREEESFLNYEVLPAIEDAGGHIIQVGKPMKFKSINGLDIRPDAVAEYKNKILIIEAKAPDHQRMISSIQNGIGQLILHQYTMQSAECNDVEYWLVLSRKCGSHVNEELAEFLKQHNIHLALMLGDSIWNDEMSFGIFNG
jgi:hypothetical protein